MLQPPPKQGVSNTEMAVIASVILLIGAAVYSNNPNTTDTDWQVGDPRDDGFKYVFTPSKNSPSDSFLVVWKKNNVDETTIEIPPSRVCGHLRTVHFGDGGEQVTMRGWGQTHDKGMIILFPQNNRNKKTILRYIKNKSQLILRLEHACSTNELTFSLRGSSRAISTMR